MKKITKNYLFAALLVLTATVFIPTDASALRMICFPRRDGAFDCYIFSGNCPAKCDCFCLQGYSANRMGFNPATDYILAIPGKRAYIVQGTQKIPIATDNQEAFLKKMDEKYETANTEDAKVNKEKEAEWAKFFKIPDTSTISKDRLKIISEETGLNVRIK